MELIPALTNYLKSYETQYQIHTAFSVIGDEAILSRTKIFLFRIVQEALSNVEHAKAGRVSVQLDIRTDLLKVTISDNGIGFDMDAVLRDPESGIISAFAILERARLVGGSHDRFQEGARHANRVANPTSRQGDDSSWKKLRS